MTDHAAGWGSGGECKQTSFRRSLVEGPGRRMISLATKEFLELGNEEGHESAAAAQVARLGEEATVKASNALEAEEKKEEGAMGNDEGEGRAGGSGQRGRDRGTCAPW